LEFSEHPLSVKILRYEIFPSAIQAQQSDKSEWKVVSDIPVDVQKWLQGVKQSAFPDIEIKGLSDISKALGQILSKPDGCGHGNLSNKNAIFRPMLAQKEQLDELHAATAAHPDLFFVMLHVSEISTEHEVCAGPL